MKPWLNSKYYNAISSDCILKNIFQGDVPCHLTSVSVVIYIAKIICNKPIGVYYC